MGVGVTFERYIQHFLLLQKPDSSLVAVLRDRLDARNWSTVKVDGRSSFPGTGVSCVSLQALFVVGSRCNGGRNNADISER